jgi:hypothetical protein
MTNLGSDCIILGHPWFKSFNPSINWSLNQLDGEDIIIETAGYCNKSRPQVSAIHFKPPSDQLETQKLIPEQHHQHWRVFSEEARPTFPPVMTR